MTTDNLAGVEAPSPAVLAQRRHPRAPVRPNTTTDVGSVQAHDLKSWPAAFQQVWVGAKTFEIRFDDRGFQRGDHVALWEFDRAWPCTCTDTHGPTCLKYTGRAIRARVGYVAPVNTVRTSLWPGHVVFSLVDVVTIDADESTRGPGT